MGNTRDEIQARMLANISNEYDKSEGSFFYDALKPVAIEMEAAYAELETAPENFFVVTATGSNLDKRVAEQGLVRKPAVKATTIVIITGNEGAIINSGDKVASDTVNFIIKESKTIGITGQESVLVECEIAGSIGNVPAGAIKYFPITLPGLTAVTNPDPVTNGYDGETDAELRARYFAKVQTPATSGNKYHYRNWALEKSGVGDAKVFPLWNGAGTVKVVIINSNKRAADAQLVTDVANYIEEQRPIGATVTVTSAEELVINISVTLTLAAGYTLEQARASIEAKVTDYLKSIAFISDFVSYVIIGSLILQADGVTDYSGLTVNGGTSNITIGAEQVAVLGVVTIA
ncbi:baseplate J protein [Thermanaerosceptrum fracticalcis]|uniref:Baseplate J protein n=1 Tax=Thermanaerosceptrum fracticalcis TaxID=1712410 RepID=A0A7G6E813_THEFR|nr:baseplate J/gp47 family protein [Thermanaerosceptrum fracticalcis]QNB48217.1 baseplate J protein [Thermanaerosceptrum fracticalcis]